MKCTLWNMIKHPTVQVFQIYPLRLFGFTLFDTPMHGVRHSVHLARESVQDECPTCENLLFNLKQADDMLRKADPINGSSVVLPMNWERNVFPLQQDPAWM